MSLFDTKRDYDKLIQFTSAGVSTADFPVIYEAITKQFKTIYGNDIDISDASADGQYLIMLSLLLYNNLQGLKYLNSQLIPASATGKFLDILCKLNNVTRRESSPSKAYLYVKYNGNQNKYNPIVNNSAQQIKVQDLAGHIWTWKQGAAGDGSFSTNFENNKYYLLPFTCEDYGPVAAVASEEFKQLLKTYEKIEDFPEDTDISNMRGSISIPINYEFEVWQVEDAILGENEESDDSLRSRRIREIGGNGTTTIEGIKGSLLEIEGVKDVIIYNNNTGDTQKAKNGNSILSHDVYIVIRYKNGIEPDENEIAMTIYNKLTPGIATTEFKPVTNLGESKSIIIMELGVLSNTIYWTKANSIAPKLTINYLKNSAFDVDIHNPIIKKAICDFTTELLFDDDLNTSELITYLNSCITPINGTTPIIFTDATINVNGKEERLREPNDTYYDYSSMNPTYTGKTPSSHAYETGKLTIGI